MYAAVLIAFQGMELILSQTLSNLRTMVKLQVLSNITFVLLSDICFSYSWIGIPAHDKLGYGRPTENP
jgi:hypothetical protein